MVRARVEVQARRRGRGRKETGNRSDKGGKQEAKTDRTEKEGEHVTKEEKTERSCKWWNGGFAPPIIVHVFILSFTQNRR